MKTLNGLGLAFLLVALGALGYQPGTSAQTTTTQTTLSEAVDGSSNVIVVSSATGFTANTTYAFIDGELVAVQAINGTRISVLRGASGTRASQHRAGALVHVGPIGAFRSVDPAGKCVTTEQSYLPQVNYVNGLLWNCTAQFGSSSGGTWSAVSLQSEGSDRLPVRLITGNYTAVASDRVIASKTYTGAITVTLPSATGFLGKQLDVMDWAGLAQGSPGGRTITVSGLIDGGASATISSTFGVVRLIGGLTATSNAVWFQR